MDILVLVMLQQETVGGVWNSNLKTLFLLFSEVSLHASERTDDETTKHMWKNKVHRNPVVSHMKVRSRNFVKWNAVFLIRMLLSAKRQTTWSFLWLSSLSSG